MCRLSIRSKIFCQAATYIPVQGVQTAEILLEEFVKELGTALRERAGTSATVREPSSATVARTGERSEEFLACRQFFADGNQPLVSPRPTNRALCYDAFAILHSG